MSIPDFAFVAEPIRFGVRDIRRRYLWRSLLVTAGFFGLTVAVLSVSIAARQATYGALGLIATLVGAGVIVWIWQRPVRGVFLLFAGAVLFEPGYSALVANDWIQYVPFFQDISSWTPTRFIFSVAEVLMAVVVLVWILKDVARRDFHFDRGSLFLPLGLYMLMVLAGEAHGMVSGGDFRLSLWEIRGQVYMFVAYILATNLIQTRRDITILVWTLLLGTGFRAIDGTIRYFAFVRGIAQNGSSLFDHGEAFFLNLTVVLALMLVMYRSNRTMKWATLGLLPFVLVADLASERRTAIAAFAVALLTFLLASYVTQPRLRRAVAIFLVALAVLFPPYYVAFSNSSGIIGEPARAIASNFQADPRDASSNLYRQHENQDLMTTMRTSPIYGYGFGKTFLTPIPLANISQAYGFWNLLPHDSILWVWMRMGTVGFIVFWYLIGIAIVQATNLLRRLKEPFLQLVALLIVLGVVQEIIFGYLDIQWTGYRNLIVIGVFFALISRLQRLAAEQEESEDRSEPQRPTTRRPLSRPRGETMVHPLSTVASRRSIVQSR